MPRNMTREFQDAKFVQQYFQGCETGDDITRKLMRDDVTLSAPELIATLLQALNEAEPIDENSDSSIQFRQQMAGLPSEQEVKEDTKSTADSGEDKTSSDGTSREEQSTTSPTSKPLFGGG